MSNEQIIKEAVACAQKVARETGLNVGDLVAHPDEPTVCELLAIRGDIAVIECDGIEREFPLNELFSPRVAMKFALEIQFAGLEGRLF